MFNSASFFLRLTYFKTSHSSTLVVIPLFPYLQQVYAYIYLALGVNEQKKEIQTLGRVNGQVKSTGTW